MKEGKAREWCSWTPTCYELAKDGKYAVRCVDEGGHDCLAPDGLQGIRLLCQCCEHIQAEHDPPLLRHRKGTLSAVCRWRGLCMWGSAYTLGMS